MNMWSVPKKVIVRLSQYNIATIGNIEVFVGKDIEDGYARRSTAIQEYDNDTKIGITASGQKYQLLGKPGLNADGEYMLEQFNTRITLRW